MQLYGDTTIAAIFQKMSKIKDHLERVLTDNFYLVVGDIYRDGYLLEAMHVIALKWSLVFPSRRSTVILETL